jgi:hypothetical protein
LFKSGDQNLFPLTELGCCDIHNNVSKEHERMPITDADFHRESIVLRQAE